MKIKCLHDTGKELSQKYLDHGWLKTSEMDLIIDQEYMVYGIAFFKNDINEYLVVDKYNKKNAKINDLMVINIS